MQTTNNAEQAGYFPRYAHIPATYGISRLHHFVVKGSERFPWRECTACKLPQNVVTVTGECKG